jgi:hypothetical protein
VSQNATNPLGPIRFHHAGTRRTIETHTFFDFGTSFSFGVATELDAYHAAYIYRLNGATVERAADGSFRVVVPRIVKPEILDHPLNLEEIQARLQPDHTVTAVVRVDFSRLVDLAPMESGVGCIDVLAEALAGEEAGESIDDIDYRIVGHEHDETLLIEVRANVKLFLRLALAENNEIVRSHIMSEHHLEMILDRIRLEGPPAFDEFLALVAANGERATYDNPADADFHRLRRVIDIAAQFSDRHRRAAHEAHVFAHPNEPF